MKTTINLISVGMAILLSANTISLTAQECAEVPHEIVLGKQCAVEDAECGDDGKGKCETKVRAAGGKCQCNEPDNASSWEYSNSEIGIIDNWLSSIEVPFDGGSESFSGLTFHPFDYCIYGEMLDLPPTVGSFTLIGEPSGDPNIVNWTITDMSLTIDAFEFGTYNTGQNTVSLHPDIISTGTIDLITGDVLGFWATVITNDIQDESNPIVSIADISGSYDSELGELEFDMHGHWDLTSIDHNIVLGCTYTDAENYDPTATIEDGSCEFASCGGAPESPISIVSEVFYADDGTVAGYPAGFTTYRIYAEMEDAADFLVGGFAFDNDILSIGSTTNTIWNNGFGAETGDDIDPGFFLFDPSMEYDSFVTVGRATSADPGGDITALSTNPVGAFDDHFGTTVPGVNEMSSNFSCSDGSWLTLAMESNGYGIGPDNRILLAQVTTDGELEYNLNLQYIPSSDPLTQVNVVGDCGSVDTPELDGSCAGFHVPENPVCCADPVAGCTYPDAENYDDLATIDDGSCTFVLSNPCPTDLNGDCEVNTGDLLMLLSDFGMWCEECWD